MYEKLKQIAKKQSSSFAEIDDIIAEAFIYIAETGCEDLEQAVTKARKKIVNHEIKHSRGRAKSIYNSDHECLDDNYYFVDERTVEKFGEAKRVSDELLAKGQALAKLTINTNIMASRFERSDGCRNLLYKRYLRQLNRCYRGDIIAFYDRWIKDKKKSLRNPMKQNIKQRKFRQRRKYAGN